MKDVFLLLQFPVWPWTGSVVARRFVYWGIQALVAFYMARDLRNRKKHGERLVKEQDRDTKKYMSIRI